MSRAQKVRDLLKLRMHPLTVREICADLNLPAAEAKFVSSILAGEVKKAQVAKFAGQMCSITHQKSTAYMWADPAAAATPPGSARKQHGGPARPRRPRSAKAAPPPPPPRSAPPPNPGKLTPDQQRRADARRAAAEAAAKARQAHAQAMMATDRRNRAFLVFERITGCRARNDAAAMKNAYRQAALKHHPDRGGDQRVFAELSAAWAEIGG